MKKTLILAVIAAIAAGCCGNTDNIQVVPYPENVKVCAGTCDLAGASVIADEALCPAAQAYIRNFASDLAATSGTEGRTSVRFELNPELAHEAYTLNISRKGAVIAASDLNGVVYGVQTLKQLLPVQIYSRTAAPEASWAVPCVKISDAPRFAYRGMELDCGRHFWSVDEIKRCLDIMGTLKLNRFHWHLTEDQGWRAEIKKYPMLTEIGAWRSGTMEGYYDGPSDNIRYGGYYTQDEMRDVVAYAANLGITIVPEVDLPGHMLAALASYPQLGCTGGPYEVWWHWGVHPDVLCLGKESTYTFLEDVLGELADIFPGEYFHIGGDEAPETRWHDCPDCQAKVAELGLKSDSKASAERRLQNYVTKRMQDFLATKGKKIIGWEEILEG